MVRRLKERRKRSENATVEDRKGARWGTGSFAHNYSTFRAKTTKLADYIACILFI